MKRKQSRKYNVVVGIPSYNESDAISHVTEIVREGLEEYFPEKRVSLLMQITTVRITQKTLSWTQKPVLRRSTSAQLMVFGVRVTIF